MFEFHSSSFEKFGKFSCFLLVVQSKLPENPNLIFDLTLILKTLIMKRKACAFTFPEGKARNCSSVV